LEGKGFGIDQLHHKVRPAFRRGAGIEDASDVGVVHQGQRLPLRLKTRDDLGGIEAALDELDGDAALHRLGLLDHPDRPHAAFAQFLQELVRPQVQAGGFGQWRRGGVAIVPPAGRWIAGSRADKGLLQEVAALLVGLQQVFDVLTQGSIAAAGVLEEGIALVCGQSQSGTND
jgi:hypothetical protein